MPNKNERKVSLRIISPTNAEERHCYRIRIGGIDHNGFLTYELPQVSETRNILLVNSPQAFIGSEHRSEFGRLVDRIRETSRRLAGAKNIVNRLLDHEFANLPNTKIAIHRFGPVPVFVLPELHKIRYLGKEIDIRIGIYPDSSNKFAPDSVSNYRLPFLSSKTEMVLSFEAGLGLMFQRYLEDVGEAMYDIKHHLGLSGVYRRAMEIEKVLKESVQGKLDSVIPSIESFRHGNTEHEKIVIDTFNNEISWVLTARYARQFALYFLNELYRLVGLTSQSERYFASFADISRQFDALKGHGFTQAAISDMPLLQRLIDAVQAYFLRDREALDEIDVRDDPLWMRRFIQFARFIASLDAEQLSPTAGRLFISYNHNVPITEVLRTQIENYVAEKYQDRVKILSVNSRDSRERFKRFIKTRIWLSDALGGIVPMDTRDITGEGESGYYWLAQEAQYGLMLGKPILFFLEQGVDPEQIISEFLSRADNRALIPSTARVPEGLAEKLVEHLRDFVHTFFTVSGTDAKSVHLDPRVREAIDREATTTIEHRHREILMGFYNQFRGPTRQTLRYIEEIVPSPDKALKSGIIEALYNRYPETYKSRKDAAHAFVRAWSSVRKRSLTIHGESMHLVRMVNYKYYSGNLAPILKRLRPDLSDVELESWRSQTLRRIANENDPN